MRDAAWSQVATAFENGDEQEVKTMWRQLRNIHQPRKYRSIYQTSGDSQDNNGPLYDLFLKMETLTNVGDSSQTASQEENHRLLHEVSGTTPKRRFTWKTYFEDDGCIKIRKGGTIRYEKICELCGKQVERSMFEYHMNQHNGVRPYACSYEGCGKQYSNKITRDRHELLIHCQDNYKYECDRCGEKFKTRSTFDYHYAVRHQSQMVPCPICGKLLKHKSLIREHVKRHTVQFPCTVCGKVLQKKYSLDVHMRTHTNEKPYSCELCSQRFMLKVQLKTHLSRDHQLAWDNYVACYGDSGGLQPEQVKKAQQ
ncbi:zinc finger protein OZF [Aedes aegypti]|uniref:C2H2-type domain-containing protein n=1 Tax=Aedes aegypti TaxID=7159 RepID=A0A6I8T7M0_AEDAE|nr:zinc finger protein OZF [Aedes aegypti]